MALAAETPAPPAQRLRVRHQTRYDYDAPVELAHYTAHLRPRETPWQRVADWRLEIAPPPEGAAQGVRESRDAFGNWRHTFSHALVHEHLAVVSSFVAELRSPPVVDTAASPPWEQVAARLRYRAGAALPEACEFALSSPYAPRGADFARFAGDLFAPNRPLLEAAIDLMNRVHAQMEYHSQSTDVGTSAVQALAQRRGVCQDFAHVAIAALRSLGLAARYVSGYLMTEPPPGTPRLLGADASHAWLAVWCPVHDWVALDPTNDMLAESSHVSVAWGRDYLDVAPLRGVIRGGGSALPRVEVTVAPA